MMRLNNAFAFSVSPSLILSFFLCLSLSFYCNQRWGLVGTTYQAFRRKTGAVLFFQVLAMHCRKAGLSNTFTSTKAYQTLKQCTAVYYYILLWGWMLQLHHCGSHPSLRRWMRNNQSGRYPWRNSWNFLFIYCFTVIKSSYYIYCI